MSKRQAPIIPGLCDDVCGRVFDYVRAYWPTTKRVCKQWHSLIEVDPTFADAFAAGDVDYLRRLVDASGRRLNVCANAASRGSVDVLRWAVQRNLPVDEETYAAAALHGHVNVLSWLHENACPEGTWCTRGDQCPWKWSSGQNDGVMHTVVATAARAGHVHVLEWAKGIGFEFCARVCTEAVRGGRLDVLTWLRANDCPWDEWVCESAAAHGMLDVLQWAKKNGCPWDEDVCADRPTEAISTCSSGRRKTVAHTTGAPWASQNGFDWDEDTCVFAAAEGHLETLKWARENGCPWNGLASSQAVREGRLEIFEWLVDNGCPFDELECLHIARLIGREDISSWIVHYSQRHLLGAVIDEDPTGMSL